MTVLAIDTDRSCSGGELRRMPLEASANPFLGSALSVDSTGYVHELVAGEPFAGICIKGVYSADAPATSGDVLAEVMAGRFQAVLPISGVAITDIGRPVYATDDNAFAMTQAAASTYIGQVIGYEASGYALVACVTADIRPEIHYSLAAAGTALTNTTTRTALASMTVKAGTLKVGSRIRVKAQAIATATNSTDTLTLDIGGAVGGTPAAIVTSAATDVANDNIGTIEMEIVIRTVGATGTAAGYAKVSTLAASATAAPVEKTIASFTIDTTADLVLGLYGTWSVASASNSCRADTFTVDIQP
jgi:hypothetical protein